jgi:alpha-L-rhamnosidase
MKNPLHAGAALGTALWITPRDPAAHHDDRQGAVWTLGRTFELAAAPESAGLAVTADGLYEVFINGRRVGDSELAPGTTPYQHVLDVQQYDVASLLTEGTNTIYALLSDGWYRGNNGTWRRRAVWGEELAFIASLTADDAEIVTDATWLSRRSSILSADLIDGQKSDLRRDDWSEEGTQPVDVVEHDRDRLAWSPAPPVRRIADVPPVSINRLSATRQIVDLGQNLSGWARIRNLGPAGQHVALEFAEHLGPDGDISTAHLDSDSPELGRHIAFHQIDEVISGGPGRDVFEPRHTVHGFRYIRVDGYPRDLGFEDITGVLVHTDFERTGTFRSSNSDLNQIHETAVWSFASNAVDVPTDCPTRERSGWTGDFQIFARAASYIFDIEGFAARWLRSLAADQLPDGRVTNITPNNEHQPDPDNPYADFIVGSSGWGDAAVHVPWVLYSTYGNADLLEDQWESISRWVSFEERTARTQRHPARVERASQPAPHERYLWDSGFHWGEWLEGPQHDRQGALRKTVPSFTADRAEIATAYYYRSVCEAAKIAVVLSKGAETERLHKLAASIREAWQVEFLLEDGRTVEDTQAAYVRALAFGLFPDHLVDRGVGHLVDLIAGAGGRPETGFLSTPFLLQVLADHGHPDLAYSILLSHDYPSWLAMLDRGATTFWEEWDGIDLDGNAHASLNHYSRGAIVEFFYTHILGIRELPGADGQVLIKPVPGAEHLKYAQGSVSTKRGTLQVEWTDAEEFELSVDVPREAVARIILPSGRVETVPYGRHRFVDNYLNTSRR